MYSNNSGWYDNGVQYDMLIYFNLNVQICLENIIRYDLQARIKKYS